MSRPLATASEEELKKKLADLKAKQAAKGDAANIGQPGLGQVTPGKKKRKKKRKVGLDVRSVLAEVAQTFGT